MEITEVRIFLSESEDKKLKAFATVTFDDSFVVRNVKVIQGTKDLFVAMPSRRMKEPCPKCGYKNTVRSRFCNQCGAAIESSPRPVEEGVDRAARQSEHRDIAHPINSEFRDYIQKKVLEAYEKQRATGPPEKTGSSSLSNMEEDL